MGYDCNNCLNRGVEHFYRAECPIISISIEGCLYFKPKQEDNFEKSCDTCDYSERMTWNHYDCNKNRNEEKDTCGDNYSRWKLRRDYNQENKEQEMSCKPTSKCTLKNIMDIAYASNCSEVYKNVVDVLNAHMINNYDLPGRNQEIDAGSPFFLVMTDRPDKCKWLTEKGITEEEISLKPCPFCGSENTEYVSHAGTTFLRCIKCSSSGAVGSSLKKADEYWNTRK